MFPILPRDEMDRLEEWIVSNFAKQFGASRFNYNKGTCDITIQPPKPHGVCSFLITTKRQDDHVRIKVYIDRFDRYLDIISGFELIQMENHGPGYEDEVFVANATISIRNYPGIHLYINSRAFIVDVLDAKGYIKFEDDGRLLAEDGSFILLEDNSGAMV